MEENFSVSVSYCESNVTIESSHMSPVLEFLVSLSFHFTINILYILYIEDSSEVDMRAFVFSPKKILIKPLFHIRRADNF